MAQKDGPVFGEEVWRELLLHGQRSARVVQRLFRLLPSAPRCKQCYAPFSGVGGRIVGLAGFSPSRKNPFLCAHCVEEMPPGGTEVDIAVLFADVRGSTATGERLEPGAFAALMNDFYRTGTGVLVAHDALIDKMIGDEVMALFIPGYSGYDYRSKAVDAAEALLRALGYGTGVEPTLPVGIAVHGGVAYDGNVGAAGTTDFTALGDTVNTAARLQGHAAAGEVVLSDAIYGEVAIRHPGLERKVVEIRGREAPLGIRVLRIEAA